MKSKSALSTVQAVILVGTVLYVLCPDFFVGPIDDTVIALVASIAELVLGFAKSRVTEPIPLNDEWEEF